MSHLISSHGKIEQRVFPSYCAYGTCFACDALTIGSILAGGGTHVIGGLLVAGDILLVAGVLAVLDILSRW